MHVYSVLGITTCLSGVVFSAVKLIAGQNQLVGIDLPVTLIYSSTRMNFYAAVVFAQFAMLSLATGNAMVKNRESLVRAQRIALIKFLFADVSIQFLPLASTFLEPGSRGVEICYVGLNIAGGIGLAINFWSTIMMNKAISAAFAGASEGRLKKIKGALAGTVKQAKKAAFVNSPLFLTFALVKSAWPFWAYMLPLQYVLIPIVIMKFAKALNPQRRQKKARIAAEAGSTDFSEGSESDMDSTYASTAASADSQQSN